MCLIKLKLFLANTLFLIFWISIETLFAQRSAASKLYGVTIDDVTGLKDIRSSLSAHCQKMTARIVFDENIPATDYKSAVDTIHVVAYTMGELVDSYAMKNYSLSSYLSRTNEYFNLLGGKVDIWEIGNEVNGEWCGTIQSVISKISGAYSLVKKAGGKTALTLYYNPNCYSVAKNEMFFWVNNFLPDSMKKSLDYVLVSYYEDDCNDFQPNWQTVFDSLHVLFPNSLLGIGECGTALSPKKADLMKKYYSLNISTAGFIGGNFWWYYKTDCVPKTKALWDTLNKHLCAPTSIMPIPKPSPAFNIRAYPNPFHQTIQLEIESGKSLEITGQILNLLGTEFARFEIKYNSSENKFYQIPLINPMPNGIYFLKLRGLEGTVNMVKILKD